MEADSEYDLSMRNAYKLITKQCSLDELISIDGTSFTINPTVKIIDNKIYDKIINYF